MINRIVLRATNTLFASTCLLFIMSFGSCSDNYPEHVIDGNSINDVALSVNSPGLEIIQIKSSKPMKGISDYYVIGDHLFLVSSDCGTVYHVLGDSVISVLEKKGRGREEYLRVQCLAYSERDSILMIKDADSEKIIKYQGVNNKVADIIFVDEGINITGFNLVDDNKLFAMGSIESADYKNKTTGGLFCISADDGTLLEEVMPLDYLSCGFLFTQDFVQCKDGLVFQKPGAEVNQIFLYKNGELTDLYDFSYNKKWRIPKKKFKNGFDDERAKMEFAQYCGENDYCVGAFMPMKVNDTLYFWSAPRLIEADVVPVLNVCYDGNVEFYSNYSIPGTSIEVIPCFVWRDKYGCFIQGVSEDYKDDSEDLSALGRKVLDVLDKNNGNPIIMLFKN